MRIGTVNAIWRFPTKSMAGERLSVANVLSDGIEGDRTGAFSVVRGPRREGNYYRGKEDETLHLQHDRARVTAHAAERGYELEELDGERYFDAECISIVVDRWLDGVSQFVGYRIEPERFRPNVIVTAADGFRAAEPDLTGRMIGIGDAVRLRVLRPIVRCVVPNYDLNGGPSDDRVLRYLAQARETWMGIYCDVLRAGVARDGDTVDVLEL